MAGDAEIEAVSTGQMTALKHTKRSRTSKAEDEDIPAGQEGKNHNGSEWRSKPKSK